MAQRRLNDKFCASAKATTQVDWFDELVPGLALRVSPTAKAWTLHYTKPDGRRARLTLGRYPALSLTSARTKAREVKEGLAEGNAPQRTTDGTLTAIVDEYFHREGAKLRSVKPRRSVFDRLILPALGDRPIADIRRSEIVRLLDGVTDNQGPQAATTALAFLSKVFNWHASRDDDFRSPIARGMFKGNAKARDRILTDDELRLVWKASGEAGVFGRYLQFLLLTAVRRNEAAHMTRAELDGEVWTIPAARMKGKAEHVVPLSGAALALLPPPLQMSSVVDGFVFEGLGLGSLSRHKARFDAMAPIAHWTLHDLRRTARSLMARAGVKEEVAERCLAHVIGGVAGVYNRHQYLEEKRLAFEALAALVARIVNPQPNVVALRP
jgi:integrase